MIIREITDYIEQKYPLCYAEDFDNVGLLVGDYQTQVTGILITLDTLEAVVEKAIEKKCNLIVSFHPIIFSGLKKITEANYVEKTVRKAIKNNIAIYALHTALDNHFQGVSGKIANILHLQNPRILIPQKHTLQQLITYVPSEKTAHVRSYLFKNGAGEIGNYKQCSFNFEGSGTFCPTEKSNPTLGSIGVRHTEKETCVSVIFPKHLQRKIIAALKEIHPYEEVAYQVLSLENENQSVGMGMIGTLASPMREEDFLKFVKQKMKTACIRHSKFLNKPIKTVAVLGGSGSFAIENAKKQGADAYISADFKYHDFYKAENQVLLMDIGHYESEQFTKVLLYDFLTKKITTFAVLLYESTNPINYF